MEKEFESMSEMNSMMAKEGCEMEEENWQEDRRRMTDDVRAMEEKKGNIGR